MRLSARRKGLGDMSDVHYNLSTFGTASPPCSMGCFAVSTCPDEIVDQLLQLLEEIGCEEKGVERYVRRPLLEYNVTICDKR